MAASYPSNVKTFTTITNATTADASQINEPREEITAIEQDLIGGLPVARGGTGATSLSINRVPYTNGAGDALTSAAGFTFDGTTLTAPATTITAALTPQALVDVSGASAGQIKFPATQNPSSDANTLDDYEENTAYTPTWSSAGTPPALGDGTIVGQYVKIGRLVQYSVLLTMGSSTTFGGSDFYTISLPFAAQAGMSQLGTVRVVDGGVSVYTGVAIVGAGASTMFFHQTTAGSAVASLFNVNAPITWANTDTLEVTVSYMAAA